MAAGGRTVRPGQGAARIERLVRPDGLIFARPLANETGARQTYGGRTEMAKKPYIIALEEHYQDPEVKQTRRRPRRWS